MTKIAIVLHDLRGGGAEKMMVRLANQLAANGDQVDLVLLTQGGVNKEYVSEAVNLVELKAKRTLAAFRPLRSYLKKSKPDGVLSALTHVNVITAIVAKSLAIGDRLSMSERNTFSLDKTVSSNLVMRVAYFLAPLIYRWMKNPVIAVSKGVADDLIQSTIVKQQNVVIAPNPVVTQETRKAAESAPQHPWLNNKSHKVIVAVGRLSYQKGFDMLIDAFYQVTQKVDARLVIFGEGELRDQMNRQIEGLGLKDKISLAGYTTNPIAEIQAADVFVLSSRFEGSPNVLVEAMSVGTNVVAFDCPHGPLEILDNGRVAPLIEYKNVASLAEAIFSTLQHADSDSKNQSLIDAVVRFSSENSAKVYREFILSSPR